MDLRRRTFLAQLAAGSGIARPSWLLSDAVDELNQSARAFEVKTKAPALFYRPKDGHVGDVIPFYANGEFKIFYLHRFDDGSPGTSWYQVSTRDFVRFTDHGEMLSRGTRADQDLSVATGSVIEHGGQYHIFYTGFNSIFKAEGKPEQGVMHAVSEDLLRWQKLPGDTFCAPQDRYEMNDWRDPFVFWNPEAEEFWMLTAARLKKGPARRRGCTALSTSKDLHSWKQAEPFWAPGLYFTHECPDLFKVGEWWYLIFSEFSERMVTRYRMSRSIAGPWLSPKDDSFDGRALYAAKTVSDGKNRFLLGWNPTRKYNKDYADWQWGGNLVVHELAQRPDGTLSVSLPQTINRAFTTRLPVTIRPGVGECRIAEDTVTISAPESFACATASSLPDCGKIEATIEFTQDTRAFGLMLRTSQDLDSTYYVRIEPLFERVVFDMWPRPGDIPFMTGLERPFTTAPSTPIDIKLIVEDTIAEIYLDGRLALSTRMYDLTQGNWGVFVRQGTARFRNLAVFSVT